MQQPIIYLPPQSTTCHLNLHQVMRQPSFNPAQHRFKLVYIIKRELANGCSGLGVFFAPIHLRVHGLKTYLLGGIVISDTSASEPDGYLSCFCDTVRVPRPVFIPAFNHTTQIEKCEPAAYSHSKELVHHLNGWYFPDNGGQQMKCFFEKQHQFGYNHGLVIGIHIMSLHTHLTTYQL